MVSLVMKCCFRSAAAFCTSESTALATAGTIIVPLIMYTGYAIHLDNIVTALRWITYINVRALRLCNVLILVYTIYFCTASTICV